MSENTFDNNIFEEKYRKYSRLVYRLAYQYTLNSAISEDIMQEVFIKLFLNKKPFANETHEKAWIIRVTINLCKNVIKSKGYSYSELSENEKSPEMFEKDVDNKLDINKAIKELNQNERTCVLLYYYESCTTAEISKILKMNENTVKSHLRRAKSKLKNILER